jgi:nitroreductase
LAEISKFDPYAGMVQSAALAILVCAIKSVAEKDPFYQQDLGAAVENLLLAATECGLGACWCGIHPVAELERHFSEMLKLPDSLLPFAVIAVGHTSAVKPPSDRYDPSRVHRNAW